MPVEQELPKYIYNIDPSKIESLEDIKSVVRRMVTGVKFVSYESDEKDVSDIKHLLIDRKEIKPKSNIVIPKLG